MNTKTFVSRRDPTYVVEAVELTDDGAWDDIATWCDGRLVNHGVPDRKVEMVLHVGEDGGVAGDWVVHQRSGFHIWAPGGFLAQWEEVAS